MLEKHHQVQIMDEAIEAAVKLSRRYIPARQLPDKAISLLDTSCARVSVSQHAVPADVEDCRRRIAALETEQRIVLNEKVIGVDTVDREQRIRQELDSERELLSDLESRWNQESDLVQEILALRKRLRHSLSPIEDESTDLSADNDGSDAEAEDATETAASVESPGPPISEEDRKRLIDELHQLQAQLEQLQGEEALILPSVNSQTVATIVEDWTGIPTGRMLRDEIDGILNLAPRLMERVIGQDHAIEMIAERVAVSRAEFDNPEKPIGVYMLCGPSGVGKTETALALSEALFGSDENLLWFNMTEFQEKHTVSTLRGSPPGYKDSDLGGVLTESVRRRPYCVILLDEIEKAHKDVHEVFFQVFDKGHMDDARGVRIDFSNTLILLTSNVGTDLIMKHCADEDLLPEPDTLASILRDEALGDVFPAAFLGRLDVIPYYPLSAEIMAKIARLQIGRIERRLAQRHGISFTCSDEAVKLVVDRCTEVESGGRLIESILSRTVLPRISREHLSRMMNNQQVARIHVTADSDEFVYEFHEDS